jgi:hypothetical protein
MTVEQSTFNVCLGAVIALMAWIVRELFKLKIHVAVLAAKLKEKEENEDS